MTKPKAVPEADTPTQAAPDPFDLSKLTLSQDFLEGAPVKKLLVTIPVRKPHRQEFFRVHPDDEYHHDLSLLHLEDDREHYVVANQLAAIIPEETMRATVFTAISRQGVAFLWPVRLPASDGKDNDWNRSARIAAKQAMAAWVKLASNMALRAYEVTTAQVAIPEPEWPDLPFQELIRIAFKDKLISDFEHPVLKKLQGRA